jgi:protein-tyrosine phosphatase
VLAWDGCVNVRDLGGLRTSDGGTTQHRVLIRADSIRGLTDKGWAALLDYGVRSAIDLRGEHEWDEDPPGDPPIPVTRIPIAPRTGPAWTWPSMLEAYLGILQEFRAELARAVAAIARAEPPVVLHCLGGRDRTGLAAALLLRLAGVDPETIAADHALSDQSWARYNAAWFEEAPDDEERGRRRRIAIPAGRTMAAVLEEIDRRYGGPQRYLVEAGTPQTDLDRIVVRLRG